jgi:UDP-N-acetyl-D-glucosamine dehydrogenase
MNTNTLEAIPSREIADRLLQRIEQRTATVGVLGLGYVGLPLAVAFAKAGFRVQGFDVNRARVAELNEGICYIEDVDNEVFQHVLTTTFQPTVNFDHLTEVDIAIICVPTPLGKNKEPDISFVLHAAEQIAARLHRGQLVVLESTTYPGTTEELLLPLLERSGLEVGRDCFLAFSPERIDPGSAHFSLHNTPKVVGGLTEQCTRLAVTLYSAIVEQITSVSSPRAAEMVKLLENTFRSVNIGLANEFAQIADLLNLDIWEVISAASTKPYGFMPFYPGPGLGGHCIPIDPLYLSWKLRALRYRARFIELASEVNEEMPEFVVDLVARALNEEGKCLNGARILALGVAYKRDISDVRESPALDVIRLLHARHAHVSYIDQHVPAIRLNNTTLSSSVFSDAALRAADCVVILTNHSSVDYARVVREARMVIDTRNATGHLAEAQHVWRLSRPVGKGELVAREQSQGAA